MNTPSAPPSSGRGPFTLASGPAAARPYLGERAWLLAAVWLVSALLAEAAPLRNGFDLEGSLVPVEQIVSGGPPRDGIPSIDQPDLVPADAVTFLRDDDVVLGFVNSAGARAYPVHILNWHEVVNDTLPVESLIVTWCPLCGSGMAFLVPGREQFGVSGLLFNSDVLLYDRATDSLWSQIMNKAISGPRRNQSMQQVVLDHSRWDAWRARHPRTLVLAPPVRPDVDYRQDPYRGYERSRRVFFPVSHSSRALHPKERVLGVRMNDVAVAYPLRELQQATGPVLERFGDTTLRIDYDTRAGSASASLVPVNGGDPLQIPAVTLYWFAWKAFHPDTRIYRAGLAMEAP